MASKFGGCMKSPNNGHEAQQLVGKYVTISDMDTV